MPRRMISLLIPSQAVRCIVFGSTIVLALVGLCAKAQTQAEAPQAPAERPKPSVAEARERARILHESFHDTLQVMHGQYFREDEGLMIPAASLKLVFERMAERDGVELRWLAVNTKAMHLDHQPRDDFEREAVKVLTAGQKQHELTAKGVYRRAGPITLKAECLTCHLPSRTSNASKLAGLLISIPVDEK